MDIYSFTLLFLIWQLLYFACKVLLSRLLSHPTARKHIPDAKARAILATEGPSYLVSNFHALYVTSRGIHHLRVIMRAPVLIQLAVPFVQEHVPIEHAVFHDECDAALWTNVALGSYLLADLIHVASHYPRLGKWDTMLHHVAFLSCALVAGKYKLFPLLFSWLIVGEASTPFLNMRWFLIKSGRGSAWYFKYVEQVFALVFLITRFFVYGAGLAYQFTILEQMPSHIPKWAPIFCMGWVVAGFVLNLTWLKKIFSLGSGKVRKPSTPSNTPVTADVTHMEHEPVKQH